jgi:hypothetical protein
MKCTKKETIMVTTEAGKTVELFSIPLVAVCEDYSLHLIDSSSTITKENLGEEMKDGENWVEISSNGFDVTLIVHSCEERKERISKIEKLYDFSDLLKARLKSHNLFSQDIFEQTFNAIFRKK